MVHENRFTQGDALERQLVEEFIAMHPPSDDVWRDGSWLKVLREGADTPDLQGVYRRLLLHAAIAVRAAGGPVRDIDIAEGLQLLRDD